MPIPLPQLEFVPHDALLVVDMQNDFFEDGALPVKGARAIVPKVNRYLSFFAQAQLQVFATRCWHPPGHCSFVEQGGAWPAHCVAGTPGAAFYPDLKLPLGCPVISKGHLVDRDAYSAFQGTDLDCQLRERHVARVFVAGLATDYCVKHTVLDVLRHGLPAFVLVDAIAAVNLAAEDGKHAIDAMRQAGAVLINIESVAA
ncbi:MAG: Nicotine deamidase [Pseudomonadota bacterium]